MRSLDLIGFGRHDPCARWIDGAFWLAARTPDGPGTIALYREISGGNGSRGGEAERRVVESRGGEAERRVVESRGGEAERRVVEPASNVDASVGVAWVRGGDEALQRAAKPVSNVDALAGRVRIEVYGLGGDWLGERAPGMLGLEDDLSGFDPTPHPLVKRLAHEHQGVRFPGTRLIFPRLLRNICEQKVTGKEAYRAYSAIVRHFKERAPGPRDDLVLPPDPERIAASPYYVFHPLGVEQKRADTLRRAAFEMPRLQQCASSEELSKRLQSIPGIGPWTAAEVVKVVFGDPDAVSVGDYHLKNIVSWALAGEPRGTDERMLELLEPFRGHRGRIILLLEAAGIGAPRYGPRMPLRSFKTW